MYSLNSLLFRSTKIMLNCFVDMIDKEKQKKRYNSFVVYNKQEIEN